MPNPNVIYWSFYYTEAGNEGSIFISKISVDQEIKYYRRNEESLIIQ